MVIGDNNIIMPHVNIMYGSRIGNGNQIHPGAVIGGIPQDLKFRGEDTTAEIGDNNRIRENVTINRGTASKGKTVVGSNNLLMENMHVAHDCVIGSNCIIGNSSKIAGEVVIDGEAYVTYDIDGNPTWHYNADGGTDYSTLDQESAQYIAEDQKRFRHDLNDEMVRFSQRGGSGFKTAKANPELFTLLVPIMTGSVVAFTLDFLSAPVTR